MPRVITIFQQCVKHKIPDELIKKLHFNDLHILIMSLDIADLKQAIAFQNRSRNKTNYDVRNVSGSSAAKMLKGGLI